jgi:hypothetical protein
LLPDGRRGSWQGAAFDLKVEAANRYSIRGLPGSFLIDRSGEIAAVAIGPRDWDSRPAQAVVEGLLE